MSESRQRKSLVWIIGVVGIGVIAAMIIVKIWFAATVFMPSDASSPSLVAEATEPLDPEEQIIRDMVAPVVPGTPVMPAGLPALNPDDYSRELARFIPIELGMARYTAKDELLLYYNSDAGSGSKVSSTERTVDGDMMFVIRRSGLKDDSLAAEETFARFKDDLLVDFGSRIQCRRGDKANEWTTDLCP